jgi:hypothetical protein
MSIRSLWAMAQESPRFMMRLNGWLTVAWFAMIPVAILTGWIESIVFVSAVSIYANMTGHLSAWAAARVEVRQDEDANVAEVLDTVKEIRDDVQRPADTDRSSDDT